MSCSSPACFPGGFFSVVVGIRRNFLFQNGHFPPSCLLIAPDRAFMVLTSWTKILRLPEAEGRAGLRDLPAVSGTGLTHPDPRGDPAPRLALEGVHNSERPQSRQCPVHQDHAPQSP
jgi:hypothetical protein